MHISIGSSKFSLFETSVLIVIFVGLYFTSWISYLLFHTLVEIFSIVVAASVFVIAWNARRYIRNPYLQLIGIAYLFVAVLDLMHVLAYKGMPIFTALAYPANQLWICARFMESVSLLMAFLFLGQDRPFSFNLVFSGYLLATGLLIASVLYWQVFPACFVEGEGLTAFKIAAEYLVCLILAASLYFLQRNRERLGPKVYGLLRWSIVCTIVSELCFTLYLDNYGFSNMVGHYFKLVSFLFIYLAIVKTGIEQPIHLIFRDLNRLNIKLNREVEARTRAERENEELIAALRHALDEIKTLKGILPICMHCNRIRDDQGGWNRLEKFIQEHSEAEFSHGVCPDCLSRHYPDLLEEQS